MRCVHCRREAEQVAFTVDGDIKRSVCEACRETKGYVRCALCDYLYVPGDMRGDLCAYCAGERDFPFFEEIDYLDG
jgi:hypothetical protein